MTANVVPFSSAAPCPLVNPQQLDHWHKLRIFEPVLKNDSLIEHVLLMKVCAASLCEAHAQKHHAPLVKVWREALVSLYLIRSEDLCYSDRRQVQILISLAVNFNSVLE